MRWGDEPRRPVQIVRSAPVPVGGASNRLGVLLKFTPTQYEIPPQRLAVFGVSEVVRFSGDAPGPLDGAQMYSLAKDLAPKLLKLKGQHPDRELVVGALLPKTVALLLGWWLRRPPDITVNFFAQTYLLHRDRNRDEIVVLRVHPSQPTRFPHSSGGP
jgi:hypothetical protein